MPLFNPLPKITPNFAEGVKLTFSTSTSDTDPGNGIIQFDNVTQNLASWIYVDLLDVNSADITAYLDSLDDSTNPSTKGSIRLSNYNDPTKWLQGTLIIAITANGYRKLGITFIAYSAASPFSNNDTIILSFVRAGDVIGSNANNYVPVHDERLYKEQQLTNNKLDQIIQFLLENQ